MTDLRIIIQAGMKIHGIINLVLFYCLVFMVPFGFRFYLPVLGAWVIITILSPQLWVNRSKFTNWYFWVPVVFFILQLVGAKGIFNSEMVSSQIETKLSLLLIPILIPFNKEIYHRNLDKFKIVFISGVLFSLIICLIIASWESFKVTDKGLVFNHLVYPKWGNRFQGVFFSKFLHPSYFSLLISLAAAMLWSLRRLFLRKGNLVIILAGFGFLLFTLGIFLLQSRAGLLSYSILIILTLTMWIIKSRNTLVGTALLALFLILFVYSIHKGDRFRKMVVTVETIIEKKSLFNDHLNETELRLWLWRSSIEVIKDSPLFGTGYRDSQSRLNSEYLMSGLHTAYIKNYNAHNQFFQSWLESGIPGLISLLILLISPLLFKTRTERFLSVVFVFLFAFNFIFESMFSRVDGIIIFMILYSFLGISKNNAVLKQKTG